METHIDAADQGDALPIGTVIDGRYTITGVIACGGMGVVHRAKHNDLEMDVALKTVRRLLMLLPEAKARFVDEARTIARLRGPHIARVFDFGRLRDGRPYLTMELLDGEDLADRMARTGRLSNEAALETLLQVCEALIEAHAAGIVHRDLKPGNLFYARDGSGAEMVRVLDFGISRMQGRTRALTLVGAGLGAPSYMAPEQIEGSAEIDHRADIWTLGVVAYEMLTGTLPFEGNGIAEICARVMNQKREPVDRLRSNAWPGLVAFVDRCLRLRPADRFEDVHAARAMLRRIKAPARIPSVIVTPERETAAAALLGLQETGSPPIIMGRRSRARWSVALGMVVLTGFVGWLVWANPERARALGGRIITTATAAQLHPAQPPSVDRRVDDAPSIAPVVRSRAAPPPVTKKAPVFIPSRATSKDVRPRVEIDAGAGVTTDEFENPVGE